MADEALSPQRHDEVAAQALRQRLIITLAAAFVLIVAGWISLWAAGGSRAVAPTPRTPATSAAIHRASDELLETTKGLKVTQQQAVDQLQVVQDELSAQKAEMSKLSEQIATLTERLEELRHSASGIPGPSNSGPVPLPKAPASKK